MNTKFKPLLFAIGAIIFLAATVFLWYRYAYRENSSIKQSGTKELINSSSESTENDTRPEQKPVKQKNLPESRNTPSSDLDSDEKSEVNSKKFDSNEDEEETADSVTVEVEADDE